jgi:hypothetical protein
MPLRAVGIAWYYRQDYRRILEIMEDADVLPRTYDQWLRSAETGERQLKRLGHVVIRAMIDPEEFTQWCRIRDLKVDAKARTQWSNEFVYRHVKNTH